MFLLSFSLFFPMARTRQQSFRKKAFVVNKKKRAKIHILNFFLSCFISYCLFTYIPNKFPTHMRLIYSLRFSVVSLPHNNFSARKFAFSFILYVEHARSKVQVNRVECFVLSYFLCLALCLVLS